VHYFQKSKLLGFVQSVPNALVFNMFSVIYLKKAQYDNRQQVD
jgi:hypothetical protein